VQGKYHNKCKISQPAKPGHTVMTLKPEAGGMLLP
jgi:hypothetical protein